MYNHPQNHLFKKNILLLYNNFYLIIKMIVNHQLYLGWIPLNTKDSINTKGNINTEGIMFDEKEKSYEV